MPDRTYYTIRPAGSSVSGGYFVVANGAREAIAVAQQMREPSWRTSKSSTRAACWDLAELELLANEEETEELPDSCAT